LNKDSHQDLAEHGADLLALHDLDGTILAVDDALAEYLGYRFADDLRGRNLAEFLAGDEGLRQRRRAHPTTARSRTAKWRWARSG
jgi:PAS domain S-box-containing protein